MSLNGHSASSERPERSRNAKAQARHRAKRKAYIEQLEQTVTKLQAALGYSPEQVSALPPSSITIRELQQDNSRLQKEIEELRRTLTDMGGGGGRRNSLAPYPDPRSCDRDYKRRKMSVHMDTGVYISPSDTPPHVNERPPPLTIPQPLSHHYGNGMSSQHSTHNGTNNSTTLFNLHGPAFQMPNTPSGSSATSSPPFSPIQMQAHVNPIDQRSHIHNNMSNSYSQHPSHYNSVKVEDENYNSNQHQHQHQQHSSAAAIQYSYSNPSAHDNTMDWHAYSSERAAHVMHR